MAPYSTVRASASSPGPYNRWGSADMRQYSTTV
jgi:hypothetical protein